MNVLDLIDAAALLKRLHDRYDNNHEAVACDLLTIIARAATLYGVRLHPMLEAVRKGARQ